MQRSAWLAHLEGGASGVVRAGSLVSESATHGAGGNVASSLGIFSQPWIYYTGVVAVGCGALYLLSVILHKTRRKGTASAAEATITRLPPIVRKMIGRTLFYPTVLFNVIQNATPGIGRSWYNRIDDAILLGALPFYSHVPMLIKKEGVVATVNTCEEYGGPVDTYRKFGITQLHIPTFDYTSPTVDNLKKAVSFIEEQSQHGGSVYVHCKAGKGRSTTVAVCYLIKKYKITAHEAQLRINKLRPQVTKTIYLRSTVIEFEKWALGDGSAV